jgi:5'-3' exonuclease
MVFDGKRLKGKEQTEEKRRKKKEENMKLAEECFSKGDKING